MKKRLLSILMALVLCLSLLPTVALAEGPTGTALTQDNISSYTTLAGGNSESEMVTYYLDGDVQTSSKISVTGYVTLDLNGHTLTRTSEDSCFIFVSSGNNLLTLTDSSAGKTGRLTGTVSTGIYVDGASFVMAGGTIDGFSVYGVEIYESSTFTMTGGTLTGAADGFALRVAGGGGSNYYLKPTMYADGGTVDGDTSLYNCTVTKSQGEVGETVFNGKVTIKGREDKMVTIRCGVFCGTVENGGEITGGIFYGGLTHIVDPNYDSDGKLGENAHAITFMDGFIDGENLYAIEVLDGEAASYAPVAPTQTGCTFDGWYNGDTEYTFGSSINENLTLNARWIFNPYTITLNANGGMVETSTLTTGDGWKLTGNLPVPTRDGYTFAGWFTAADGGEKVTTDTVFDQDTTIYAHWTAKSSGGSYYSITVLETEHGSVTVSPGYARRGAAVTVTVKPDKGYTLETLTVTDASGKEIELTNNGDGKYTFKMPASKVTVKATFMEDNSMLNFFVDVFPGDYYYDAVLWAAENGITGGTGDGLTFSPNAPCTRAQIVTFLWRAAGSPAPESSVNPFTDVAEGSYYYDAVLWAVEQGITKGTSDTTFSPNATCTRAQAMTFLYRSQKSIAADGANPFTDVAADAYYADAVLWAVENGVTNGTSDTTFSPGADCTRAQIVTFLYRFFVK